MKSKRTVNVERVKRGEKRESGRELCSGKRSSLFFSLVSKMSDIEENIDSDTSEEGAIELTSAKQVDDDYNDPDKKR